MMANMKYRLYTHRHNDLAYTVVTLCSRYLFAINRHQMTRLNIMPRFQYYTPTVKGMTGKRLVNHV